MTKDEFIAELEKRVTSLERARAWYRGNKWKLEADLRSALTTNDRLRERRDEIKGHWEATLVRKQRIEDKALAAEIGYNKIISDLREQLPKF